MRSSELVPSKESWMGMIPKDWKVMRLKDVAYLYSGLTGKSGDDFRCEDESITKPFIPFTNILNNTAINTSQFNRVVMNNTEEQNIVKKGDLLFLMSSEDYESIAKCAAVCDELGEVYLNSFCRGLRFHPNIKGKINPKFIAYELSASMYRDALRFGARGFTRINIKIDKIASMSIALPSIEEQERIVNYIDRLYADIDANIKTFVQKKSRYIFLKKSIIFEAVLKGLNPDVEMKDSGIDWMGFIPRNWEIKRMKQIFCESKAVSSTGDEDLLSVSEYYGVARRIDKMSEDEEFETRADSLIGYKKCAPGELVINIMLAWKTGLGISDFHGIVSPAYAVYKGKNIVPHYYHYLLRTNMYVTQFKRNSKGIIDSRLRMYTDRFNNIPAIYPPLEEQQAIADYLDEKCAKIDSAIEIIDKQIEKYTELKKSLINEVITGKQVI